MPPFKSILPDLGLLPDLLMNCGLLLKVYYIPPTRASEGLPSLRDFPRAEVVFHRRWSFTKGRLPPKGIFHKKVFFHQRLSSTKGPIPSKVGFTGKLSSTQGRLPPKVAFHQGTSTHRRLSSNEGCLPPKVVFY